MGAQVCAEGMDASPEKPNTERKPLNGTAQTGTYDESELAEQGARVNQLQQQNDKLKVDIKDLQNQISTVSKQHSDEREQIENTKNEQYNAIKSDKDELLSKYENSQKELNSQIDELNNNNSVLMQEKERLVKDKSELAGELEETRTEMSEIEKQRNGLLIQLQNDNANADMSGNALQEQLNKYKSECDDKDTEISALKESVNEMEMNYKNSANSNSQEIEKWEREKNAMNGTIENLKNEYDALTNTKQALSNELKDAKESISALKLENQELSNEHANVKRDHEESQSKLSEYAQQIETSHSKNETEVADLNAQVAMLSESQKMLKDRLNSEQTKQEEHVQKSENNANELQELQRALDEANSSKKEFETEIANLQSELSDYKEMKEKESNEYIAQISVVSKELDETKKSAESNSNEKEKLLQSQIDDLNEKYESEKASKLEFIETSKKEVVNLKANVVALTNQKEGLEADNASLKTKCEKSNNNMDMLMTEVDGKDAIISKLQDEIKDGGGGKPSKPMKPKLEKLECQITYLSSESSRAKSLLLCCKPGKYVKDGNEKTFPFLKFLESNLSEKAVNQLYSKFKSDKINISQVLSLLTLTAIIYRVKLYQLQTGKNEKPKINHSGLKKELVHLAAWLIRSYGTRTDNKQVCNVKDDDGNQISGEFTIYEFELTKSEYSQNMFPWVKSYIDSDANIELD